MINTAIELVHPESSDEVLIEKKQLEKLILDSEDYPWQDDQELLISHLRKYEWQIPNWTIADNYPKQHTDLEDWQWKWEFIRRWSIYRFAFLYFQEKGVGIFLLRNIFGLESYIDPRTKPAEIDTDPFKKFRGGTLLEMPSREDLHGKFFKIHGLSDSDDSEKLHYLIDYLDGLGLLAGGLLKRGSAFFRFEMHQHLNPQMKRIKTWVDNQQELRQRSLARMNEGLFHVLDDGTFCDGCGEEGSPFHDMSKVRSHINAYTQFYPDTTQLEGDYIRSFWVLYLRVIDADDQGARPMEIFRQFAEEKADFTYKVDNEASVIKGKIASARKLQRNGIIFL